MRWLLIACVLLLVSVAGAEYVKLPKDVTLGVCLTVTGFESVHTSYDVDSGTWYIIAKPVFKLSRDLNRADDERGVNVSVRIIADLHVVVRRAELETKFGRAMDGVTSEQLREAIADIALSKVLSLYAGD